MLPDIEVLSTVTPSPHHPLGVKGIGEAGTIASTVHGLQRGDRRARSRSASTTIQMPLTPERVWRAMQQAQQKRSVSHVLTQTSTTTAPARSPKRSSCSPQHPGAKLLAGGHSLIPLLKLRLAAPPALIDIGRIAELRGIARQGDTLRIGALTTHAELAASADAARRARRRWRRRPRHVGDPAVSNRGTIGGNVAHADPASDLPTVLVALDARFVAAGPKGERTIAARASSSPGMMTTALGERRDPDGDRGAGDEPRAGIGVREVRASGVALRRHRRRGAS